ncbi:hypothetical protein ACFXDJ_10240 [Streptomyces sp. NPDC059443]
MSDKIDPTNVQADENTEVQVEDLDGGPAAAGAYTIGSVGSMGCLAS